MFPSFKFRFFLIWKNIKDRLNFSLELWFYKFSWFLNDHKFSDKPVWCSSGRIYNLMKIKYIFNLLLPFQMKRKKAEGITLTIFPFLLFIILFNIYFFCFCTACWKHWPRTPFVCNSFRYHVACLPEMKSQTSNFNRNIARFHLKICINYQDYRFCHIWVQ